MEFDYTKEPGRELFQRGLDHMGTPLVSIITPYYNAGKYFEQTFNCVMNQTFPWFEWIIVDDSSTKQDDYALLIKLAATDSRIKVYQKENGGPSSARNYAIERTHTDIIVSLDADDLIDPTYIETTFWALKFHPNAGWAYTDSIGFDQLQYQWKVPFSSEKLKRENFLIEVGTIRKKVLLEAGKYDDRQRYSHEDWRLWLQILNQGYYPVHCGFWGAWYRRVSNGAFNETLKDPQKVKWANKCIAEVAEQITDDILPAEYPSACHRGEYTTPKRSDWDRKVFKSHDKLHVMMLLPWMEMGGADLFNLDVCRKIDKSRFEVSILTTVPGEQSWRQRFEEYVTDIFDLPSFLEPKDFPEFISYFIQSREVDVLFLSNSYDGYYLVPWLRKEFPDLAIIDYVHMEEWYWRNGGYARTAGAMGEVLEKTYVCNERTRRVLIRDFDRKPESVETLYIGVDQELYDASKVESGLARKELGIGADRPIVLFPCRIHPQKRPFLMMEIAKEVRKQIPNIAFVVVGDGPQFEELKIAVQQNDLEKTVYLAGRQKDMRPYYKDSAMTLICSLKEGLALTAYESLSMGKPVVTSDVGGQAELIDDTVGRVLPLLQSEAEELDSRAFTEEEIRQYADAIAELLGDTGAYEKMCAACRRKIEEGFSSQIMIRKLEQIFENLVNDPTAVQKRRTTAAELQRFGHLISDHFTMYRLYEAQQAESEEVWKSREWFRELYENAISQGTAGQDTLQNPGTTLPEATLRLYRSGKIGFKYILKYILAWAKYKLAGEKS